MNLQDRRYMATYSEMETRLRAGIAEHPHAHPRVQYIVPPDVPIIADLGDATGRTITVNEDARQMIAYIMAGFGDSWRPTVHMLREAMDKL